MSVGVYAVTYFPSNQVTYDNKTSGLKSSDVWALYKGSTNFKCVRW